MTSTYYKTIKLRVYPNKNQTNWILENFRNCKFIWNKTLRMLNNRYENNPNLPMLSRQDLGYLRKPLTNEYIFLKKGDSKSYEYVFKMLLQAFDNFFNKTHGYPSFKRNVNSYMTKVTSINVRNRKIKLPKVGWLKYRQKFNLEGLKFNYAVISRNGLNEFYISIIYQSVIHSNNSKIGNFVGIEMGTNNEVFLSNGEVISINNISDKELVNITNWRKKTLRREMYAKKRVAAFNNKSKNNSSIKRMQLSDCRNYKKSREILLKKRNHYLNRCKNHINNVTTDITKRFDLIVVGEQKTRNMINSKNLLNINNNLLQIFNRQLERKCIFYGKKLIFISSYDSYKNCYNCGYEFNDDLNGYSFICPNCHAEINKYVNASKNILCRGLKKSKK